MIILGLGTNLGDRERRLRDALTHIGTLVEHMQCSSVYESPALLPHNAPPEWNKPFLNMAVGGRTHLTPLALLAELKAIERKMGRRDRGHWGPREIDIDILVFGDVLMRTKELTLPHAQLLHRDFALIPLAELAPEWEHPDKRGQTARQIAGSMTSILVKTGIAFV